MTETDIEKKFKVHIKLQNCRGIKDLEDDFDFYYYDKDNKQKKKVFIIYGKNGSGKTSLAETFYYYKEDKIQELYDRHDSDTKNNNEVTCTFEVQADSNSKCALNKEIIEYIASYDKERNNISSSLVECKKFREDYNELMKEIQGLLSKVTGDINSKLGIKKDKVSEQFLEDFDIAEQQNSDKDNLFISSLGKLKDLSGVKFENLQYRYIDIFNDNTLELLKDKDFTNKLDEYINMRTTLINESQYLNSTFDHSNMEAIKVALLEQNFFDAKHYISLKSRSGNSNYEVGDIEALANIIIEERKKIDEDKDLKNLFYQIEKKLNRNKGNKDLWNIIKKNKDILVALKNTKQLKHKMWFTFYKDHESTVNDLLMNYNALSSKKNEISDKAKDNQQKKWNNLVSLFNDKFQFPFYINCQTPPESLLKEKILKLTFKYKNGTIYDKNSEFVNTLSAGEKRVLYWFYIIADVELIKTNNQPKVLVIDDIVDSFDYQNKNAIIEWLCDLAKEKNFYLIILTHNFDFLRTLGKNLVNGVDGVCVKTLKMVNKDGNLKLKDFFLSNPIDEMNDFGSPFSNWQKKIEVIKKKLSNTSKEDALTLKTILIAMIPFVRELINYSGKKDKDYTILSNLLHYRDTDTKEELKTESIKVSDLITIVNTNNSNVTFNNDVEKGDTVYSLITETCEELAKNNNDLALEDKLALAVGIRLNIEKYKQNKQSNEVIQEIDDLYSQYKRIVNPLIHMNAFMYEAVIDTDYHELQELYKKISNLLLKQEEHSHQEKNKETVLSG